MSQPQTWGRVNWKAVGILIAVVVVLGAGAVAGRYAHKRSVAASALVEGQSAFARQDWPAAARAYWRYLQRYPDDAEILARYAHAQSQVRPLDGDMIQTIIAAYRRLVRYQPDNEEAYDQLARLYAGIRDTDNLAYVARQRLARQPNDLKASVWLAHALSIQHKPDQIRQVLLPALDHWAKVPGRRTEYIDGCSLLSQVAMQSNEPGAAEQAQQWLDRAVEYAPEAPEALLNRARLRRTLAAQPRQDRQGMLAGARQDLERADSLPIEDPRQRLILSDEWMRLGQLDRAAAQLDAVAEVKGQAIARYFFDATDWRIALYLQTAELDLRRGRDAEAARQADGILAELKDKGQRLPVLPTAVRAYVAAGRLADAERCLHEYQANQHLDLSATPSEETSGLLEALVARAQRQPYRVIELLEPITARSLANPIPWRMLAEAYTQTDQTRRSIRAIRQYLSLQPDDLEMTRMLMRNYVRQQDWSLAAAAARSVQALDPDDLEAQLLRIEDAINRAAAGAPDERPERMATVWKELDSLARQEPDKIDVWILRAAAAASQGDLDRAESELRQGAGHGLDDVSLAQQRSHLYLGAGRPEKAIAILEEACSRGPQTRPSSAAPIGAWLELADLQRTRGQVDRARRTLEAAAQVAATPAARHDVQVKRAVLEVLQGSHREGVDLLRSLAAQDPADVRVRTMLLAVPDVQQDAAEAERLVDQIRQVEGPRGLTWRLWQASAWLARPDWRSRQQEIEANLQRCLDADPGWAAPALLLAGLQEQVGSFDRAEAIYRNVLAADPGALQVADRLLSLLQRQGRLSQARDVLKNLDVTDAALSSRHTLVAMATGQVGEAIDQLKLRASHDPQDAQSRVLLAHLVYRQSRDVAQAMRYLDEADAVSPGSIAVTMGRVIILNSEGRRQEAAAQLDALVGQKDSFEARRLRGSYLASTGQIERAERDYVWMAQAPGDGTGHEVLGQFYVHTQRLDQAIRTWREGLAGHADNLALKRSLMKGLLQRGDPADRAEALQILADLETRLPSDAELMTLRAGLLMDEHTQAATDKAETLLERAAQIAPTYVEAHLGLVSVALQRHEYPTARKRVVFALGINPADSRLLILRAQTELAMNNHVMARDLAGLVLKEQPHNAQARSVLVQAALAGRNPRDLQNALEVVAAEASRTPGDLELQMTRALLLASLGQADQAIADLQAYVATPEGSRSTEAIVSLADLYQSRGDLDRAEQLLARAAALQPDSPAVLRGQVNWLAARKEYGRIVLRMGDYASRAAPDSGVLEAAALALSISPDRSHNEQALTLYQAAIRVAADPLPAQVGYASLAYRLGQVDAAEGMYRKVLQANPTNVQALNDLAWLLCKDRGQGEQALDLADRAARLAPGNIHVRDTRGTVLASLPGRLTDARREFETCVDLSEPDSADRARALLQLGRVFAQLGDATQARQRLQDARRIDGQQHVFNAAEQREIDRLTEASMLGGAARTGG